MKRLFSKIFTKKSTDLVLCTKNELVQSKYSPDKPTMYILPVDRPCLDRYIVKAYGALVSAGAVEEWVRAAAKRWRVSPPEVVIPEILEHVNICFAEDPQFKYFQ